MGGGNELKTEKLYEDNIFNDPIEVSVAEPHDIEQAFKVINDAHFMYERGLIDDKEFLHSYTTITEDNLYFRLNEVKFPIDFSVASMMKYGGKHLLKKLIDVLEKNQDGIIRLRVEPK